MFKQIIAAMQASAAWCNVPVAMLTRDQYRAARASGVHDVSDANIRPLGTFAQIRSAAAAQEDFSVDTSLSNWKLKAQLTQLKKEKKLLLEELGHFREAAEMAAFYAKRGEDATIRHEPQVHSAMRTACAVAVLSDLHIEETVDPESVAGVNDFNLNEAHRRLQRFFEAVDWMVRHHRNAYQIDTLILAIIGDLISGYIHEELVEVNELSPTEAIVWLNDRIIPGIRFLLDHTGFEKIIIPCCFGNHSRTTRKTHISTIHKNNLELFVYDQIRRTFSDDPRIEVKIAQGELVYVDIWDYTIRFTHGDAVKGGSGMVGPISGAMRKIAAWDTNTPSDVTVMGHWHRYTALPNLVINGSLIGFGPYTQHIGALYEEPSQAFFLMDYERGKTFDSPLWVRDLTSEEDELFSFT